jgi:hypothetical protein
MNIYVITIAIYTVIISISYAYIEKMGLSSFAQVLRSEPSGLLLIVLMVFSIFYIGYYKYIR